MWRYECTYRHTEGHVADLPVDIPLNYTIDQEIPPQSKDTSVAHKEECC